MTLRHKRFGKWAQYASKSDNPSLKQELVEHYERGKQLREKIKEIDSESSDAEDMEEVSEDSISEEMPNKGVMAMKFMQRAHQKQKQEYNQLKENMQQDEIDYEKKTSRRS